MTTRANMVLCQHCGNDVPRNIAEKIDLGDFSIYVAVACLPAYYAEQKPVIPCEPIHTNDHPFCDDMRCPCHNDDSAEGIAYRREYVIEPLEEGLLTPDEAANLFTGWL